MLSDIWHITPLFFLFVLSACQEGGDLELKNQQYIVKDSLGQDSAIASKIAPYKKKLKEEMSVVLGYSAHPLHNARPEGGLGNFVADLLLERTQRWAENTGNEKPDLALLNHGGLRTSLPEGAIRKRRIFKLMPFENVVEVLRLDHDAMRALFRYLAHTPQPIAGAELVAKGDEVQKIRIQGKPLDSGRYYHVATSDFLARGGDGMDFFKKARSYTSTGIKVRDMIIRHIRSLDAKGDSIRAKVDGRVKVLKADRTS